MAGAFTALAKANGWQAQVDTYDESTADFSPLVSKLASYRPQVVVGYQGSLAAIVGLVADAVSAARSTSPQAVAAAARKLSFGSSSGSAYPFPQSGGVMFDASQDNTGFVPPIIQLEGTAADPEQVVVSPAALATGKVDWPVSG